jgi:hypothetical protein
LTKTSRTAILTLKNSRKRFPANYSNKAALCSASRTSSTTPSTLYSIVLDNLAATLLATAPCSLMFDDDDMILMIHSHHLLLFSSLLLSVRRPASNQSRHRRVLLIKKRSATSSQIMFEMTSVARLSHKMSQIYRKSTDRTYERSIWSHPPPPSYY